MSDDGPAGPPYQRRRREQPAARGAGPGEGATRIYQGSVRVFSVVLLCIGVALIALTLANGGGPASVGVLMGVAFFGVGAARLWVALRMSR